MTRSQMASPKKRIDDDRKDSRLADTEQNAISGNNSLLCLEAFCAGEQGRRKTGRKGVGRCMGGGEGGVGSGIPKVVGEVYCMPIQNLFVVHISVVCCVNIILLIYRSIKKNQITDDQP